MAICTYNQCFALLWLFSTFLSFKGVFQSQIKAKMILLKTASSPWMSSAIKTFEGRVEKDKGCLLAL